MSESILAIDAMGGDHGVKVTVLAALTFLEKSESRLLLVGNSDEIKAQIVLARKSGLAKKSLDPHRFEIVPAQQVVAMDERPVDALRKKKYSSMRVAIDLVKQGRADACVSAGNTGALMAIARFVLKTVPGIDRPAIVTAIPGLDSHFYMLDLGANVDCSAEHLKQFALMGALLFESLEQRPMPRVGLINIGSEDIKGNGQVKAAHQLLNQRVLPSDSHQTVAPSLQYIGYVEPDGLFFGGADVAVCDGFVGNVALKSMEGVAKMIAGTVKAEVQRSLWLKLSVFLSKPAWLGLKKRLDPGRYNGASLIGLLGTVVKSHGSADVQGFEQAIRWADNHVKHHIPSKLAAHFTPVTEHFVDNRSVAEQQQ